MDRGQEGGVALEWVVHSSSSNNNYNYNRIMLYIKRRVCVGGRCESNSGGGQELFILEHPCDNNNNNFYLTR